METAQPPMDPALAAWAEIGVTPSQIAAILETTPLLPPHLRGDYEMAYALSIDPDFQANKTDPVYLQNLQDRLAAEFTNQPIPAPGQGRNDQDGVTFPPVFLTWGGEQQNAEFYQQDRGQLGRYLAELGGDFVP